MWFRRWRLLWMKRPRRLRARALLSLLGMLLPLSGRLLLPPPPLPLLLPRSTLEKSMQWLQWPTQRRRLLLRRLKGRLLPRVGGRRPPLPLPLLLQWRPTLEKMMQWLQRLEKRVIWLQWLRRLSGRLLLWRGERLLLPLPHPLPFPRLKLEKREGGGRPPLPPPLLPPRSRLEKKMQSGLRGRLLLRCLRGRLLPGERRRLPSPLPLPLLLP